MIRIATDLVGSGIRPKRVHATTSVDSSQSSHARNCCHDLPTRSNPGQARCHRLPPWHYHLGWRHRHTHCTATTASSPPPCPGPPLLKPPQHRGQHPTPTTATGEMGSGAAPLTPRSHPAGTPRRCATRDLPGDTSSSGEERTGRGVRAAAALFPVRRGASAQG
jgi:hypothetical protein